MAASQVLMKTIIHVVGARPNYMKIAPLMAALEGTPGIRQLLVNTGQHYDEAMSTAFLRELGLPAPDRNLDVGSASHAVQTAKVMMGFETVCLEDKPDLVVVVGDVNSTMAATLVAAKLLIPVAHLEAGLRSFDRTMPEEINRIVTDRLADLLLTPSKDADDNLRAEGVPRRSHSPRRQHHDRHADAAAAARDARSPAWPRGRDQGAVRRADAASPVERRRSRSAWADPRSLARDCARSCRSCSRCTREPASGCARSASPCRTAIILTEPLGYIDFLSLTSNARIVLTDSGGLQEESTALGIPCLTLRENTERPVTVTDGTNRIVGMRTQAILASFEDAMAGRVPPRRPPLWDGQTGPRTAAVLTGFLSR